MEKSMKEIEVSAPKAGTVLRDILRHNPRRLAFTGVLVLAENALDLFYPVVAGIALDAVLEGDLNTAFIMVGIIFLFWLIGALRRAVDTRVYTWIYRDLVARVILSERKQSVPSASIIVHAGLARQFVDFFEIQVPAVVTAGVSVAGAVIMLIVLEPLIGMLTAVAFLISILTGFRFVRKNQRIAKDLHDRQEHEPTVVTKGSPQMIARHFRIIGGRRIQLSDLEAKAYVGIGVIAAVLFGALFIQIGSKGDATAGHLFMLMSYLWTFVENLDEMPEQLQEFGKLKELGTRIAP